jgi:Large polyvalent protein-associated domain 3
MPVDVVARVTNDELGRVPSNYLDLVNLAARYVREQLAGRTVVNHATQLAITMPASSLSATTQVGAPRELLLALPALPAMLSHGGYVRTVANASRRGDVRRRHLFAAAVDVVGRRIEMLLVVRENFGGQCFFERMTEQRVPRRRQDGGSIADTSAGFDSSSVGYDSATADKATQDITTPSVDPANQVQLMANDNTIFAGDPAARSATRPESGRPVVLPNGLRIPADCTTGCLMSPVSDLEPVAAAGRELGKAYTKMLNDPDAGPSAAVALYAGLNAYVGHGGVFDYQRRGNHIAGFTQLPQYRDVSNFNVGLFCQQAGLSLEETLRAAGFYARNLSSNARPDQPYGLDPRTSSFITQGYNAGASGVFGQAVAGGGAQQ